jgi:hypothetical protein
MPLKPLDSMITEALDETVAEIGGCKAQGNSATAEGRHLEPTLCFKGIENYNYQRLGTQNRSHRLIR